MSERLRCRPCPVDKKRGALAFIRRVHRRQPVIQGGMWAIGAWRGERMVGVALVGWPARKWTNAEIDTLCVLRVAVEIDEAREKHKGFRNACSKLYAACWTAARAMGSESMVTYTHLDEPGESLRGAGWEQDEELTDGGEWSRPSRPRQMVIDSEKKRRWWAPGSKRAQVGRPSGEGGR